MAEIWSHTPVLEGLHFSVLCSSSHEPSVFSDAAVESVVVEAGASANGGCRVAEQRDPVVSSGVINASVCSSRGSQERVGCRASPGPRHAWSSPRQKPHSLRCLYYSHADPGCTSLHVSSSQDCSRNRHTIWPSPYYNSQINWYYTLYV